MDCLKNKNLLNHHGKLVECNDVLKDKQLIVYYFSAAWCGPCKQLLQLMKKVYDENRRRGMGLEVIYVSSDTEEDAFLEYFNKYHGDWYAIPFADPVAEELRLMYGVSTVPTIIVVKKDGVIVTEQGQKEIETNGINVLVIELREKYDVSRIPYLVIVTVDGALVTLDGRSDLEEKVEQVIEHWMKMYPEK